MVLGPERSVIPTTFYRSNFRRPLLTFGNRGEEHERPSGNDRTYSCWSRHRGRHYIPGVQNFSD